MAEYEIDSLEIEVKADTGTAERGVEKLQKTVKSFSKFNFNIPGLGKVSEYIAKTNRTLGQFGIGLKAVRSMDDFGKRAAARFKYLDSVLENATERQQVYFSMLEKGFSKSGANSIADYWESKTTQSPPDEDDTIKLRRLASEMSRMDVLAERLKNVLSGVSSVLKGIFSIGVLAFRGIGSAVKKVGGLVKSGFLKVLDRAKQSLKDMNRQLGYFKSVLRNVLTFSAFYNILRAINEAFKTGTDNLYQYSKALGGQFAQSMDALASTLQYFQNSIGALTAPIINLFTPAIEAATDRIVEMTNAVNQMIASLTGASTWTKAVKVQKEYAEAANDASKANKNLLAGFDELNVIQSKSSGSSAATPDYGSMFTEVSLEGYQLPDFVQRIKDSIASGDWAGAAKILAEKINSVFAGIPWGNVGTVIGNGLQTVVDSYNSFMRNLNFEGIGSGIAQALNNLMERFDFTTLGQAFVQKFNAAFDMAYTFVAEFDWSKFGVSISNAINGFISEIDWKRVGKTLGDAVSGVLSALVGIVESLDYHKIGAAVTDLILSVNWSQIMHNIAQAIGAAIGGMFGILSGAVSNLWTEVKNWWYQNAYESGQFTIKGLIAGILEMPIKITEWFFTNVVFPLIDGVKNVLGIHSPSTVFMEIGQNIMYGLFDGLKSPFNTVTTWVSTTFNNIKTTILNVFNSLKTGVSNVWNGMWNSIRSFANSILGGVEKMVNGVIRGFNNMINAMNRLSFDVPDWVPVIGGNKFGFNIKTLNEVSIPRLADGGFVSSGQLFMARENGMTEYVGSMGNRAAVANNDQIVSGIASGVAAANSEQNRLLSEQNSLLRQLLAKEGNVVVAPSPELGRVMSKSQKMYESMIGAR